MQYYSYSLRYKLCMSFVLQLHAETEVPVEPQRIVATSKCNYKLIIKGLYIRRERAHATRNVYCVYMRHIIDESAGI